MFCEPKQSTSCSVFKKKRELCNGKFKSQAKSNISKPSIPKLCPMAIPKGEILLLLSDQPLALSSTFLKIFHKFEKMEWVAHNGHFAHF